MIPPDNTPLIWQEGGDFVGAKLVLTCGADLLVSLRDDFDHIPWPAHWDLPGGGRDGTETALACALRELTEEFGLHLPAARLAGPVAYPYPGGAGLVSVYFRGEITQAEIAAIRFGTEGQCWRMMPVAEYLTHPRAVPHFPARVAYCLGLRQPD